MRTGPHVGSPHVMRLNDMPNIPSAAFMTPKPGALQNNDASPDAEHRKKCHGPSCCGQV
jgi:hypothetical protein